MREHLVRRFADAGLKLVLSEQPIVGSIRGSSNDIVQIDIQRQTNGSRRHEWFRIFPGAVDNRIEVVGTDKNHGQVVLMVHEIAREFEEQVPWATVQHLQERDPENWVDLLCKENHIRKSAVTVRKAHRGFTAFIKRKTPSQKRHFLCGLDERQLFIAQLPKAVSTVREAHACLKTTTVSTAEGQGIRTTRQGEWFFLEPTAEELAAIELGLEKRTLNVERAAPIGPFTDGSSTRSRSKVRQFRGNPHTADELVVLPGNPLDHGFAIRGREVYIRGKVRHVDHKTVSFKSWRKVIRNAEPNSGQASGVGWVD